MVVLWIILVKVIANQLYKEVSVDSFVVVEGDKIEIVETEEGADDHNRGGARSPDPLVYVRRFVRFDLCGRRGFSR